MNKYYQFFFIVIFSCFCKIYGQQDCFNALSVCSDANSDGLVFGYGEDDFKGTVVSGCLGVGATSTLTVEANSYWFRVKLAESGQFGFIITPNDLSEDWDFAVYGPDATCGALDDPVACNYRGEGGYTGVGVNPSGDKTNAFDDWMDVNAGDVYFVLVNQYDGTNAGFSISWTGAVIDNHSEPLDCNILVELGPTRELCEGGATNLNVNTFISTAVYNWFKWNDLTNVYDALPVYTTTTPYQLYVTQAGNYKVEVVDSSDGSLLGSDDIDILVVPKPIVYSVSNFEICDANEDGVEVFDLDSKIPEILNGQTNVNVTFYEFESFAALGINQISGPYTSGSTTIWARLESNSKSTCYELVSFDLVLTSPLVITNPNNLIACDDDNDGEMVFDLESQTPIILNGQSGVVTYYRSEEDARDPKGPIPNPALYLSRSRTIWARAEKTVRSNCPSFTSFEIKVSFTPTANLATAIKECDVDNDGFYQFDFRATKDAEIVGLQDPALYEINYFNSQNDALTNTNALEMPYTNKNPYVKETIFARIQNKENENCFDIGTFTIQVFDAAKPAQPEDIPDLVYCDNDLDGDDTNGFYEFDLTEREIDILNGQSPYVFNVTYYEDSGYINQILNPTTYTNTTKGEQTIYVKVGNSNPNNLACFDFTSFKIKVNPLPNAILSSFDFIQCDEDGVSDGFVNLSLAEADEFITLGNTSLNVSYHLSLLDAASGINAISKNNFSNQTASTVYARVTSAIGCYRIVQVNIVISVTSFPTNYHRELVACDNDNANDGLHVFDLAQTRSEILSLFLPIDNLKVTYYRNANDATLEINAITSENAYLSEVPFSQDIWVRVESVSDGGCFAIKPVITLTTHKIPEFDLEETAFVCLNNTPLIVSATNPQGTYTYEWTDEFGTVISNQQTAQIFQGGVYSVVATSNLNCSSFIKKIIIEESNVATISPSDVVINSTSGTNTVTVLNNNQSLGIGNYEFSIDDITGPYQEDATFYNVVPGKHEVYIRDINNCGIVQTTIYVFGFPNFFTPNNDGNNDTWNVLGIEEATYLEFKIYIYDRFGKMMASFNANEDGWNGLYDANKEALSTDYWYLAQMVDNSGNIHEFKGHFSLVRR